MVTHNLDKTLFKESLMNHRRLLAFLGLVLFLLLPQIPAQGQRQDAFFRGQVAPAYRLRAKLCIK